MTCPTVSHVHPSRALRGFLLEAHTASEDREESRSTTGRQGNHSEPHCPGRSPPARPPTAKLKTIKGETLITKSWEVFCWLHSATCVSRGNYSHSSLSEFSAQTSELKEAVTDSWWTSHLCNYQVELLSKAFPPRSFSKVKEQASHVVQNQGCTFHSHWRAEGRFQRQQLLLWKPVKLKARQIYFWSSAYCICSYSLFWQNCLHTEYFSK